MMLRILSIYIFLLSVQTLSAQVYEPEKVKPKAVHFYEQALDLLHDGDFHSGIPLLGRALAEDNNFMDAWLSLAGALGQQKKYDSAVLLYEKARSMDTAYFQLYNLPYSINLAGLGKFREALTAVNDFLRYPRLNERSIKSGSYRKNCYLFALQYDSLHHNTDYVFSPQNLGDSVNTIYPEYYPSVTVTDSFLVFTRRDDHAREMFMESAFRKKGFGKSKAIEGDINLETNKGALSVSQDGDWMVFAGELLDQQMHRSFDIYISYYTPQGWSAPVNMGEEINTDFYESGPTLSPDKRALYFCSNRPGGYGGLDLYVSYRQANGKWGPAVNMGPEINSAGDEQAPFIHADNQTLYFTSNGLPGYGESDLFVIRKKPDGSWGKPENLGYPINTIENEGSMAVSADGLTAYYASDRSDSRGGLDLYRFDLRPDIRPYRTLYVKGTVLDANTHKPLPSQVNLIDNQTQQPLMEVKTDELGAYFITLPTGKDYTFTVNRKGYVFYSADYDLSRMQADSVFKKDIYLQPVAIKVEHTFQNIHFSNNAYLLPAESHAELDQLAQVMQDNPSVHVQITGYTDNVGNDRDNQVLSENRAKAIVDYLVQKGIDGSRLQAKGMGAADPVADNNTEAGRAQNRRTTFTIIGL